jgi:uncharacterized protein CbrC (UPF0167 family)
MAGLPDFPYHPDPIATGSVERSEAECVGEATAYLFRCRHCGTYLAYSDFS